MMFKKGASNLTIATMVVLGLGLLYFFIFATGLGAQVNNVFTTLNGCNNNQGMCFQNHCGDARMVPQGNIACRSERGENYVCCTSEEIKQQVQEMKEGILPDKSEVIVLSVKGKTENYPNGERIRVFTGEEYTVWAEEEIEEGDKCALRLVNSRGDILRSDGDEIQAEEGDCGEGNKLTFRVPPDAAIRSLSIDVQISNNGERIAKASYDLEATEPIRARINGDWNEDQEIRVTCAIGGCIEFTFWPLQRDVDFQNQCFGEGSLYDGSSISVERPQSFGDTSYRFSRGESVIDVDEEMVNAIWSETGENNFQVPLCFEVNMDTGESLRVIADDYFNVDKTPPEINLDGVKINCTDKGSGCDKYYVAKVVSTEESDLSSLTDSAIQAAISKLTENNACPDPSRYPQEWVQTSNPEIDITNIAAARICAYAVDEAGNPSGIDQTSFADWDIIKNSLSEEAWNTLDREVVGRIKDKVGNTISDKLNDWFG